MTRRPQFTHWLHGNEVERSPHRVLVIDTETRPAGHLDPERQVLRLWSTRYIERHDRPARSAPVEWHRGTTATELSALVESLARADQTLWLFTHNLNFDLAVTALPVLLAERGWSVTQAAFTTDAPWCRMAKGKRRLTIADSWTWLPTSVAMVGDILGLPKLDLPATDDDDAAWWARCDRDVQIVAEAMTQVMDWWDAGQFGNWSITGPATGWSSYRHRMPKPKVLIDPDGSARAFEMRAVTGGRRTVTRLGRQPLGLYADVDMTTAHLTVMAHHPLPYRRLSRFDSLPTDHPYLHNRLIDVLAECTVRLARPRYPWDSGAGIFYPTGTFRSVLAGPEIREAAERGELVSIGPGYPYLVSRHMAAWAHWLAGVLDESSDAPAVVRLLTAKGWSRSVPGKWAGHTSDVVRRDPDPRPGWAVEHGALMPSRRPADFLRIGGERWTITRDEWADDSFPAILAFIQSYTRQALNRLLDAAGPAALLCNTDGALLDANLLLAGYGEPGSRTRWDDAIALGQLDGWLDSLGPTLAPFTARIKGACGRVEILSPQHVILDRERRLAGIPQRAVQLGDHRYTFTTWPKLRVQLERDEPPGYRTAEADVTLAHVPPAGWLDTAGRVWPVHVLDDTPGAVALAPYVGTGPRAAPLAPPEMQHPRLRLLMPPAPPQDGPSAAQPRQLALSAT